MFCLIKVRRDERSVVGGGEVATTADDSALFPSDRDVELSRYIAFKLIRKDVGENRLHLFRTRAKHFLTAHVLSSLVLMAPFLFWMMVFVQVFPDYQVTHLARYFFVNNSFQSVFFAFRTWERGCSSTWGS